MRWEVFYNDETKTVTVIDAPEGHEFEIPPNVGSSIGNLTAESKAPYVISKSNSLMMTWLTQRFAMLGIEDTVEHINHLPML